MEFNKMIKEICDKNNIKCTFLSKNWVVKLEKDDMTRYITGNKFDLNGHALGNIMDDKYAFYEVMKDENIDIIEHKILYKNDNKNEYAKDCNSYEVALNYFYKNNCNIVLKSNCGACGNEVFHITDEKSLYETLDNLFINNFSISMCPFYKIKNEYVSEMALVLLGYQKLIESGADEVKNTLLASIECNKEKLLNELKQIKNINDVAKEQCCIARMFILYLTIENMLQDANSAGIQLLDGVLGLDDIEIERRLFTYFRTGILGAMFLGQNDIYTFDYWKDGSKVGRKYCAFQIKSEEKNLICMVVLKERKNNLLSKDIVEAIKKIEKKLDDSWKERKEIELC